jgi:hypothetical protein
VTARPAKVSIPEHLFNSTAFRALDVAERWLIVELIERKRRIEKAARDNGREYDDIVGCSVREAANMLGVSKSHAGRAMAKLSKMGFIAEAREPSHGARRCGTSTGWRLTFESFQGEPATFEYLKIADRAARQADADRVTGESFYIPGMEEYEPPDDDGEVSRPWDTFDPGSVPPMGQVSNTDPFLAAQ